jgi:hypothetical protein
MMSLTFSVVVHLCLLGSVSLPPDIVSHVRYPENILKMSLLVIAVDSPRHQSNASTVPQIWINPYTQHMNISFTERIYTVFL